MNANDTSYSFIMTDNTVTERVTITRVINPCALIEVGRHAVLTDPYFDDHWLFPMNEPIGLRPDELPELAAILGGHRVLDHWQPQSLRTYRYRSTTPVFVASKGMARSARHAGLDRVEVLRWNEQRDLGNGLTVECVPGEPALGTKTNSFVLRTSATSIYVGTEARHLHPITRFAATGHVDIAVLPIDGLRVAGRRLVMNAAEALNAAQALGAHTLVPIHYSQRPIRGVLACTSGIEELLQLAGNYPGIKIMHAAAGTPIPIQ
jgi:L-ascorbate metabolism protein UlaG (beta-lactamase superfamily)